MNIRQELSCFSSGVNPRKFKLLNEYLLPGSCLDIGCGNGLYGGKILERCSELLQIDVVDRRLPEACHYPFRIVDANHLYRLEQVFDNAVAFDIMEHLADDAAFLEQVHRLCREEGGETYYLCSQQRGRTAQNDGTHSYAPYG